MEKTGLSGILIIMAKQPSYGAVKTRLCPPLTEVEALRLYEAFLSDTIALVDEACTLARDVTPALAYTPLTAHDYFLDRVPGHFRLLPQQGSGLGERLSNLPVQARSLGYDVTAMISSDSPTLRPNVVASAFSELAQPDVDVVIGPCMDGGYYLIGMKAPAPVLFTGITWSTSSVTAETLAAAREAGLGICMLPTWSDVDTVEDLFTLQEELEADPNLAPYTRSTLSRIRLDMAALMASIRSHGVRNSTPPRR